MRRRPRLALCAALGLAAATCTTAAVSGPAAADTRGPDHVFLIMMENHGFSQIIGNTADAPFTNALAARSGLATNYHGVTHPSLPNYLAMISGSAQGIYDDCKAGADVTCAPEEFVPDSGDSTSGAALTPAQYDQASHTPHLFSGRTLVDQLEQSGRTWRAYMENLPEPGSRVEFAPTVNGRTVKLYAQKHNPFLYFSRIASSGNPRLQQVVPFEHTFAHDLDSGTVPTLAWISPNQCHDMHGISASSAAFINQPRCGYPSDPNALDHGAIQLGDEWLRQTVSQIEASTTWRTSDSRIVLAWDENDYSGYSGGPGSPVGAGGAVLGGGDAPLIVVSSHGGPAKTDGALADHYSVLRALENAWHLGCLGAACDLKGDAQLQKLFTP